ncbi:MAG: hypothetical protein H6Q00_1496, partial [Holophagaceae bacterium]|nr:hypothetical protein [Holophagaceae bacterium]
MDCGGVHRDEEGPKRAGRIPRPPISVKFPYTPSMETLTLELIDVTVSQAVTEMQVALSRNPQAPIQVLIGPDEMIRHNLLRVLERAGRRVETHRSGSHWHLEVAPQ